MNIGLILALIVALAGAPADRDWQTGTWGATQIGGNVRTYVIETETFRFSLEERAARGSQPIKATAGATVTFAIEKNTAYVRDGDNERALAVAKVTRKLKSYSAAGPGHLIKAVGEGGQTITLEDGSVWEVEPAKQFMVVEWEAQAGASVHLSDAVDGFNYVINNLDVDDWVAARLAP